MADEIVELTEDISKSPLYSADMAPVSKSGRTWTKWNLAALWVGMAVCIPTYILASYMITTGLTWLEALIIIGLANIIITIPMVLNGHAGVKYGIPFPVVGRASFGTRGIHIASVARALVACGWFGVQTWIGGLAIYEIWCVLMGLESTEQLDGLKFICFGIFWFINVFFIWKGTESIKWLEEWAAPILIFIGLVLIAWGVYNSGGFTVVLQQSTQLQQPAVVLTDSPSESALSLTINPLTDAYGVVKADEYQLSLLENGKVIEQLDWLPLAMRNQSIGKGQGHLQFADEEAIRSGAQVVQLQVRDFMGQDWIYSGVVPAAYSPAQENSGWSKIWLYLIWLTAMVGFWATMAISIADITRYSASQQDQIQAQFIGLPGTMMLFSFVGIFVTCASILVFKDVLLASDAPWNPTTLLGKFSSQWVVVVAQIFMILATLSTNIAANVIAPANAFANLIPNRISWRMGGLITALIGIVLCPWWILNEIQNLLIAVSGVLGPVLAILICDYFVIRRKTMNLSELYKTDGEYSYGKSGFNLRAIIALLAGVVVAIVGYFVPAFDFLYKLSWFSGFATTFLLYYLLMRSTRQARPTN